VNIDNINNEVGDMDLCLLDLILKGEVNKGMMVLDAGCGSGRNLLYFLKQGYDVRGIDLNESEVRAANFLSRSLGSGTVCSEASLEEIPFENEQFDLVICSRVLHFSESKAHFKKMTNELMRIVSGEGILYLTMDSMIGLEQKVEVVDESKYQFPDGSIRFMLTEALLKNFEKDWDHLIEPRTVNFNGKHAETTLILRKP
jgi:ubiquinone/menaquinone biosynthesis C-methylase UbiE